MRVRENGRGGGRHRAWIWGADAMAFNPADYRDRILIAGPDLAAEIISRGWSHPAQIEHAVLVRPELVRDAADVFVDAGAEILLTPTARASGLRPTFSGEPSPDVSSDVVKANQAAAAVLRDSADGGAGEVVNLCYFAGLTVEQAADVLDISRATAYRHWTYAKVWLHAEIRREE